MSSITHLKFVTRVAILVGLLASANSALGATLIKDLTGTVVDGGHHPLKSAVVKLENEKTQRVRSYITAPDGSYFFRRLIGDTDFLVWASFRGHRSGKKTLSYFDDNTAPVIDLVIDMNK